MGFFDDYISERYRLGCSLKRQVDAAINCFEQGNIPDLQQKLYEIYSGMNKPGGGKQILEFDRKDRLCEIFTMCLRYDWMHDSDIREVWAENGFYCIATYLNEDAKTMQDMLAASLDLFFLIHYGETALIPKISEILHKASIRAYMGIGIEGSIFNQNDFNNGAEWLLNEFSFFAATWISKIEQQHPQIISADIRPAYEKAKRNFVYADVPFDKVMSKMKFIAQIIESILNEM